MGSPAYAPKVLNPLVLKRTVGLLKSLLEDPRVLSDRHAGGYLGEFYKRWIFEQQQLAALRRQPPGPFVLPSVMTWSPDTLSGMNPHLREASTQMVYRALHLVQSVKPAYLDDTVFRARTEKRSVLSGKDLKIMFLDTRDRKGRDAFAFPVTVDGGHWCPSETIIVTAGHEQFFRTAFWTDHIFYNNQGADPDALANMTVALASELYGGIQRELYTRASDMKAQSVSEVLTYRQVVLRRGATFVDALKANPLWGTLTDEEKASFNKVRGIYEREADGTKCLIDILKKSGEDKK